MNNINGNNLKKISASTIRMLCRRVSTHDLFNDDNEIPHAYTDESDEDNVDSFVIRTQLESNLNEKQSSKLIFVDSVESSINPHQNLTGNEMQDVISKIKMEKTDLDSMKIEDVDSVKLGLQTKKNNVIVETPVIAKAGIKRQLIDGSENHNAKLPKIDETIPKRRITPLKIGEVTKDSTVIPFGTENVDIDEDSLLVVQEDSATLNEGEDASKSIQGPESKNIANGGSEGCSSSKTALNEIGPNFQKFINACKKIDDSKDMDKIIQKKLLKYYHAVHPDFINSKVFQKILKKSIEDINETPNDVYVKLKIVIEELDIRRRSNVTVIANEEVAVKGTGDEKKDEHLNKLYKSLLLLKKRILKLEHEDVDFDANELDSSYIMKERFEKRACQTYEKICELTGESSHAHRIIKKPITFKGTDYPQFNKKIQKMVNKNNSFPNYREILRCLDYCNKNHNFKLTQEQMKRIAQDAFEKLGKVLQQRRKTELYESASYFVGSRKDPAKQDGELRVKLEKNKKHYSKITDLIDEFAEKERNSKKEGETDEVTSTSNNNTVKTETPVKVTEKIETITKPANEVHKQTVVNGSETSTIVSSSNTSNIVTLTIEDDDSIILL